MLLQYMDDHIRPILAFANVGIFQMLGLQLPDFYENMILLYTEQYFNNYIT